PTVQSTLQINVRNTGAKGDGQTDDTAAIQEAITQVSKAGGGTVLVPDGVYRIDAVTSLRMANNVVLRLQSPNAQLKALPNAAARSAVVDFEGVSSAAIIGGTVIGERDVHRGSEGEHGMGVRMTASNNIVIDSVTAINAWGDGAYVGGNSKIVKFCNFTASDNRRQGLSITWAEDVTVINSVFKNTGGTSPQSGIDIEPNKGDTIRLVKITGSRFENNQGYGILVARIGAAVGSVIEKVTIENNTFSGNVTGGIAVTYATAEVVQNDGVTIQNNRLLETGRNAITLTTNTRNNKVINNTITGGGILDLGTDNVTTPNTISR
ncbi:MAG: glycosyl hydrolase family 28-related protein, partial [Pseudomonadota bacterium]|nr:glycosyl hydrolase family 28-related protein [Pseudomonadota bacterium]